MWASLWSIYDGPSGDPEAEIKRKPTTTATATGRAGAANDAGRRRHEHGIASSNGNNNNKQSVYLESAADNTIILRGVIVGEERSGKSSLVQRLRGENPYQQTGNNGRTPRDKSRKLMALVPWRFPKEALLHQKDGIDLDDLVQLYVSESKSFCYATEPNTFREQISACMQPQRGKEIDFAVWMIDPRMDSVIDYLRQGLDIVFPSAPVEEHDIDDKEGMEGVHIKSPLVHHLCVLLNFRDLVPTEQHNDNKDASLLEQVQHVVKEVANRQREYYEELRQIDPSNALPTPTIMVYESSTKNCYGLQNFHSFVALPYLSRKEHNLRQLAEQTHNQRSRWERGLMEAKRMEYQEFIEQSRQEKKQSQNRLQVKSIERQRLEEEKERLQRHSEMQKQMLGTTTEKQEIVNGLVNLHRSPVSTNSQTGRQEEDAVARSAINGTSAQRKVLAKSSQFSDVKMVASTVSRHTNLESFFSDDEDGDEEDEKTEIETCDSSDNSEGYDSDDGDFYIDGSGARCVHATLSTGGKQSAPNLTGIPRDDQNPTSVESANAEPDSSVLLEDETKSSASIDGVKDEVVVGFEGTAAGPGKDSSKSVQDSSIENPDHANDTTAISISSVENSQVDAVERFSTDTNIDDKSLGTNTKEMEGERTPVDSTIALDDKDRTPTNIDELPEELSAIDADDPSSKQIQSDGDEAIKSTPASFENESGDEQSDKHDSEQRHGSVIEQFVLNSDEDSICQQSEGHGCRLERIHNADSDKREEEIDNPMDIDNDDSTTSSLPRESGMRVKSSSVSSAALAAIEAAKIEAERMMAHSQSDEHRMKREKKSKKKDKDGKKRENEEKKKRKKKDKRRDTSSVDC